MVSGLPWVALSAHGCTILVSTKNQPKDQFLNILDTLEFSGTLPVPPGTFPIFRNISDNSAKLFLSPRNYSEVILFHSNHSLVLNKLVNLKRVTPQVR